MRRFAEKKQYLNNKTGLQPVSRPAELVHYLGVGVGVQSPLDAIAVQTVTFLAMHTNRTGGTSRRHTLVKK